MGAPEIIALTALVRATLMAIDKLARGQELSAEERELVTLARKDAVSDAVGALDAADARDGE